MLLPLTQRERLKKMHVCILCWNICFLCCNVEITIWLHMIAPATNTFSYVYFYIYLEGQYTHCTPMFSFLPCHSLYVRNINIEFEMAYEADVWVSPPLSGHKVNPYMQTSLYFYSSVTFCLSLHHSCLQLATFIPLFLSNIEIRWRVSSARYIGIVIILYLLFSHLIEEHFRVIDLINMHKWKVYSNYQSVSAKNSYASSRFGNTSMEIQSPCCKNTHCAFYSNLFVINRLF